MSTFLQLCQDLERESGTVAGASAIADVTAPATSRQTKIVGWVKTAWRIIQTSRSDWQWMIAEFEKSTVAGQARYTASGWSLTRFNSWVVDTPDYEPISIRDPAFGLGDEAAIRQTDYPTWRMRYGRGAQQQNRPHEYAISHANELCLGAVPDKAYTLRGEYRKSAQALSINADVPECPEDYHDAILWRALMLLGDHDEAPIVVAAAQAKFVPAFRDLVIAQTGNPVIPAGGTSIR